MNEWIDGWTNGRSDGWTDGWMDGWMGGWIDESVNQIQWINKLDNTQIYQGKSVIVLQRNTQYQKQRIWTSVTCNSETVKAFASMSAIFSTSIRRSVFSGNVSYSQRVRTVLINRDSRGRRTGDLSVIDVSPCVHPLPVDVFPQFSFTRKLDRLSDVHRAVIVTIGPRWNRTAQINKLIKHLWQHCLFYDTNQQHYCPLQCYMTSLGRYLGEHRTTQPFILSGWINEY